MRRTNPDKVIRILLAGLALAVLGPSVVPQKLTRQPDQDDVIRVDTSLIQVRAVITDRAGKLVDNLKQDDFEILEDGRPPVRQLFLGGTD
jgi:hypothetical protein